MGDACPVRVAIRCRPLVPRERNEGCQQCLTFAPNQPQLTVGSKHTFTYDYVLPPEASQEEVYTLAVKPLIQKIFNGYNATVLAYGQTGSGKTYSMGTGDALTMDDGSDEMSDGIGVIPRVIRDLFDGLIERQEVWDVKVSCSYFELYNEEINDLFAKYRGQQPVINIREIDGEIVLNGLSEEPASSPKEVLTLIMQASEVRTVGSTAMNHQSSRSHACFTLNVNMSKKGDVDGRDKMSSKFHLVDLAGSERAKKTKAEGDRFKEGVNINRGLLALGNVIAALGDEKQRGLHVNYRDSKLTRILQDSLGGNSNTLMIACVSPADSNMEETVNTLRYADRAKNIKNKPVINMDPLALEIHRLKKENQRLRAQLLEIGISPDDQAEEGDVVSNDPLTPKTPTTSSDTVAYAQLRGEKEKLDMELATIKTDYEKSVKLVAHLQSKYFEAESARESLMAKVEALEATAANLNASIANACGNLSGVSQPASGDAADASTDAAAADNGSMATQTSFLDVQEQLKMFQSQFTAIKDTVQGEETANEQSGASETESADDDAVSKVLPMDEQEHLVRQARFGEELSNLDNMLKQKELQLKRMKSSDADMDAIRQKYEESVSQLEKEIEKLTKEKKELQKTVKISEERRKKVKDLEEKMGQLRKQSTELNRLKKMKEENDKMVRKMTEEVVGLKAMRVKHIRQMKADAEEFRKWKQASAKEVKQLKEAERKRHCALMKLERKHELQGAVLKRKTEEALAAKRRLDDVLKKRDEIKRQKTTSKDEPPPQSQKAAYIEYISKKIEPICLNEIESRFAESEGRRHLEELKENRSNMMERKRKLEAAKAKGLRSKQLAEGEDADATIAKINRDIELANCQVTDLNQNILDLESTKETFKFSSLTECKAAFRVLLQKTIEAKTEEAIGRKEKVAVEEELKAAQREKDELARLMQEKDADYENRLSDMLQQNEEKVLFFLRNPALAPNSGGVPEATAADLSATTDADMLKRLKFQEGEIDRLQSLADELDKQRRMNRELTIKMKTLKDELAQSQKETKQASLAAVAYDDDYDEEDSEEGEEMEEEAEGADEWSPSLGNGNTPLRNAWVKPKSRSFMSVADPRTRAIKDMDAVENRKRRTFVSSEVLKCKCTTGCNARCGCRRVSRECSDACGCRAANCKNRASIGGSIPPPIALDAIDDSKEEQETTLEDPECFAAAPRIHRAKKSDKENSVTLESAPPAPSAPRLSRQRSRPLGVVASVDQNAAPAPGPSAPSLDGTFNVNSIEDDPIDAPVKRRSGESSDENEGSTLDGDSDIVEGTPEGYKIPALKASKAHKYVAKVTKEGGYFSPKYVPDNPGLRSDDVV